ncbi:Na+/H+ antiporter NhaC [[Clostridium] colinum]|uniref:Na+/H+ antiporter NhaC n=1 Tax=[Clostridium] colinum TaxID=36835 RepID=UPI0020249400|nr:Na+/H+ antiporter NhaC [[Clostridium] colinum]
MEKNKEEPSLKTSIFILLGILLILLIGISAFKINIVLLLILCIIYIAIIGKFNNISEKDIIEYMSYGCSKAFIGLLFFILIGGIIGIFILSGTVPTLVYYGLDILSPNFFLPTTLLICTLLSSIIGSSWSTVGTVGIATTSNLAIPIPIIVGAIISGAWFGDKMSPVSDSTVMTATSVNANVYDHIKVMSMTTLPSYIISLIVYTIINSFYDIKDIDINNIQNIKNTLDSIYNISILNFIPLIVLIFLSFFKINAIKSIIITIGVSIICALFLQDKSLYECFDAIMNGISINTSNKEVNTLLNRGGINSMMSTFLLCFFALSMGGILEKSGFVKVIIKAITNKINSTFALIFTTMSTCILGTALFADIYLSIILNGNMYKEEFKKRGLKNTMLSRTIEEGTTLFAPLIPWTAASAFITATLNVQTVDYAKYTILNLVNPLLSLIFTFLGIFIVKHKEEDR